MMKSNRQRLVKFALLIAVPLVLFALVRERYLWRPRTVIAPGAGEYSWYSCELQFSPDGLYLYRDYEKHDQQRELHTHPTFCEISTGRQFEIAVPAGARACFIGNNAFLCNQKVYAFPEGTLIAQCPTIGTSFVEPLDEKTLLGFVDSQKIWAWDFRSPQNPRPLSALPPRFVEDSIRYITLLPDKRTLMIGDFQPKEENGWIARFWDMKQQKMIFEVPAGVEGSMSTAKELCAWFNEQNDVEIWNYHTGRQLRKFHTKDEYLALSPDGDLLASGSPISPIINLQNTQSGKTVRTLKSETGVIQSIAFSPDGRTLASLSEHGTVQLWRIK